VADSEQREATEEEVDAEIANLAERMGEKPAAVRRQLERVDQIPAVRSDLRKGKALEWLIDRVEVVDEEGKPIDRADFEMAAPPAGDADESPDDSTPADSPGE